MTDENTGTGFSKEYVEKLRSEAAEWRVKYRQLEAGQEVSAELARRGVKADPSWVKVEGDMSVKDAVDDLLARFPHLESSGNQTTTTHTQQNTQTNTRENRIPTTQMNSQNNTNVPSDPTRDRSLEEIKKDPKARAALRDQYRELLAQQGRQRS